MKSLFIFLFCLSFLFGAEKLVISKDLKEATKQAKVQNKKILVFVHADYCSWCDKMKETTLKDPQIIKFINSAYIFVSADQEKSKLPDYLIPKFVPTTYLIDPKTNKVLTYLPGYKSSEDFIEDLKGF